MMRRAAAALTLVALIGAAACGGSHPDAGPDDTTPATQPPSNGCELAPVDDGATGTTVAPAAPIEVTVWEPFQGRMQTALERVVSRYNASQTRVKVLLDDTTPGTAVLQARVDAAVVAKALPSIVVLDAANTQAIVDSKAVAASSTCIKNPETDPTSSLPVVRATFTVDHTRWAWGTTLDTPMLYVNRAHFIRAGLDPDQPPRTLAELATAAAKLAEKATSPKPLAVPMQSALIESWLTGAGALIVDQDNGRNATATASAFDNPRTTELFQWLHDSQVAGTTQFLGPDPTGSAAMAALVNQTSSMAIAPAADIGVMDAFMEGRGDPTALGLTPGSTVPASAVSDLDVAPLPGLDGPGRGQIQGQAWYVTAGLSPDAQAAAWDFLRFLGDVDSQVLFNLEASVPPSNTKAVDAPAVQAVWGKTPRGHWLDTAYTQITNFDAQAPGPLIGPAAEVEAAITASFAAVTAGGQSPAEAIAGADGAIDAALSAYRAAHPD